VETIDLGPAITVGGRMVSAGIAFLEGTRFDVVGVVDEEPLLLFLPPHSSARCSNTVQFVC
jgi:hypothetical protein